MSIIITSPSRCPFWMWVKCKRWPKKSKKAYISESKLCYAFSCIPPKLYIEAGCMIPFFFKYFSDSIHFQLYMDGSSCCGREGDADGALLANPNFHSCFFQTSLSLFLSSCLFLNIPLFQDICFAILLESENLRCFFLYLASNKKLQQLWEFVSLFSLE